MVSLAFRILLAFFLLRLLLRFVAAVVRGMRQPKEEAGSAVLVRDPICQTFVSPSRAVRGRFEGHVALFCSVACRDQAAALPGAR